MRVHVMEPWLETIYKQKQHFDYQYIHQVFTYLLDECESPKNRLMQPHAEGWYAIDIWSILIDKAFLNIPNIELVRHRKALGRRIDSIFQNTVNGYEYGGIEVAKTSETFGYRQENLKLWGCYIRASNYNSFLWIMEVVHVYALEKRIRETFLCILMITIITNILRAKLRIKRCIEVLKNEPEDESFLQEITHPPSRPSTPSRTAQLAKPTTTPKKDKQEERSGNV
ncbi:hypothetical protein G9A89_015036 [Geosiphon pyriformis]|nr:hypothetical protein G9A89_015036 [Geosiphon pyriformis]